MQTVLDCAGRILNLTRPNVMGVLNVTPDSFSDGGRYNSLELALLHARGMVQAGAQVIDVGGESTRPNALQVSVEEEIGRVVPVIEALHQESDVVISIDTSSPDVMRAAVAAGAGIINDVRALARPGAVAAAVECDVPVVLMHSLVEQSAVDPEYDCDIAQAVGRYLTKRVAICEAAGLSRDKIVLDPGFGGGMFGKTPKLDLELISQFSELHALNLPLLVGVSRKSFIGAVLKNEAEQRLAGSLAVAILLAQAGAHIIRVHDVQETVDALTMLQAVNNVRVEA